MTAGSGGALARRPAHRIALRAIVLALVGAAFASVGLLPVDLWLTPVSVVRRGEADMIGLFAGCVAAGLAWLVIVEEIARPRSRLPRALVIAGLATGAPMVIAMAGFWAAAVWHGNAPWSAAWLSSLARFVRDEVGLGHAVSGCVIAAVLAAAFGGARTGALPGPRRSDGSLTLPVQLAYASLGATVALAIVSAFSGLYAFRVPLFGLLAVGMTLGLEAGEALDRRIVAAAYRLSGSAAPTSASGSAAR